LTEPIDIKAVRLALGLSQGRFAAALGLRGANARITVSEWERGEKEPSGPVLRLLAIWTDPRCPRWAKPGPDAQARAKPDAG
jgi:DNA-binding transcriptional regulator YiaG